MDYLIDGVDDAARAKGELSYVEDYKKPLLADIMREKHKEFPTMPVSGQERDALADPRYKMHIRAIGDAVQENERHKRLLISAEAVISVYQTESANNRGAEKLR